MGSIQSYLTSPTALILVAVVGAASYVTSQRGLQPPSDSASPNQLDSATKQSNTIPGSATIATASSGTKKNKKKKQQSAVAAIATSDAPSTSEAQPNVIPGGFEPTTPTPDTPTEPATKSKKKKKAKKAGTSAGGAGTRITPTEPQSDSSATAPESHAKPTKKKSPGPKPAAHSLLLENDGPWTRVEPRKRTAPEGSASSSAPARPESDAGITSITGTSSSVADEAEAETSHPEENRRTLAEKLLPKPRKTGVEDMLETPDVPTIGRVLRVQPRPDEKPPPGFSWADYEDVDETRLTADDADGEDEGGWVTKSTRPKTKPKPAGTQTSQPTSAPETLTKKQRQNAAKREAQKAAKADAEAERLAALAKHKREVERAKIAEQLNSSKGKKASGGMSSYVNEKGQLVWD